MEGLDRPAAVAAKRSGSPKYNECAKALRPAFVGSPLLLLSQEEGGCCLYKPDEDKFYETKSDFSGYRFLASSDDKNGDFVVVWQFEEGQFLGFCKKGNLHYRDIPIRVDVRREFRGLKDVVLKGYNLYSLVTRSFIRHLDLSGQDGFKDVSVIPRFPMWKPDTPRVDFGVTEIKKVISFSDSIAVTTSGEVLLVFTKAYEPFCERSRIFRVYKRDPKELDPNTYDTRLVEMESIGDEALFFDLGITVPADHTLGIEPNSIYFTRNDRFGHKNICIPCLIDICVYNIATRTIKRFPSLSNLKLKDAQWFLPS
ncbi:unnamed protein product [Arabidopsis arenosa]|uniref:KIB1-4 beta-propeller domain-containing protein n=1 Tax=Arabidopsis arenosa TaxID=38785 RepID=A0A8S2AA20_ARAAE|nr:unnamed protein product [Arabidopsis arenosa]